MHLAYFDENKFTDDNPNFWVGGLLIPDKKAIQFENILSQIQYNFFGTSILSKETEFHGKELFHGKGYFKNRKLADRVQVFHDISSFLISNMIPIRMVCINVIQHKNKYSYPMPEYRLGLMLILERFCDYLDTVDDLGIVFGDYEKDELTHSVLDFSQFKSAGRTPMYFGRPLGRLLDTVYFTHSHHSRFLQVADLLIFLAGRYENNSITKSSKWHEQEMAKAWQKIKANGDIKIQRWP
jgi:hypothetical protein